ncbi:hypothetical protein [Sphingobium yanoikuyae]|uniref:hypothetical protein n=1 Tax=Sphingobium yanoikuyae TaxID=13690 RepID=UPI000262B9C8|nr:hypothetical protein [Sphingobium yanoikuyae]
MSDAYNWLVPSAQAVIAGIKCECYSRLEFDRRGGGMVLLRRLDRDVDDIVDSTLSLSLCDLVDLDAAGQIVQSFDHLDSDHDPDPTMPTIAWLEAGMVAGRLIAA